MSKIQTSQASRFSIKIYGDNLLTPATRAWIGSMTLAIFVMVTVESLAWGYAAGWLLGDGEIQKWVCRVGIALVVAAIFWMIDRSFLTLDVEQHETQTTPPSANQELHDKSPKSKWDKFKQLMRWPLIPVGSRVILVLATVALTAPIVALYELRYEIDHDIQALFLDAVHNKQLELEAAVNKPSKDAESPQLRAERDILENKREALNAARKRLVDLQTVEDEAINREREIARELGESSESPKPPRSIRGLVQARRQVEEAKKAYDLQNEIVTKLRATLTTDDTAARTELYDFRQMVKQNDYVGLKDRFFIQQTPNSWTIRWQVAKKWMDTPEFFEVIKLSYGFMAIIAGGIFIGKYYQPKTARIYYSEQWQARWASYLRGDYDEYIPQKFTVNREQVSPIPFCKLWRDTVEKHEKNKDLVSITNEIEIHKRDHQNDESRLNELNETIGDADTAIGKKEIELKHAEEVISTLNGEMETLRNKKDNMMEVLRRSNSRMTESAINELSDIESQMTTKKASIADAQNKRNAVEIELGVFRAKLPRTWKEKEDLEKQLEPYFAKLKALQEKRAKVASTLSA